MPASKCGAGESRNCQPVASRSAGELLRVVGVEKPRSMDFVGVSRRHGQRQEGEGG